MGKNVLLIQGHPDAGAVHLCHALEDGYRRGALQGGHAVEQIDVARLGFPLLRAGVQP